MTTANIFAEVCEKIGADWNEIVPALQLDKRIGEYAYLKPGLGISGGNLERDLATILKISEEKGTHNSVIKEWVANSKYRKIGYLIVFEMMCCQIFQTKSLIYAF